jgi:hypothetical protein
MEIEMLRNYWQARRIGGTRRESLRLAFLMARLALNDAPTTDVWGRPAASSRRTVGS